MVGSFKGQHFQKSRKFHELPRKWFPGGAVLGDTGREGGKRLVEVREQEGRKVGGGGREEGVREDGGRGCRRV